MVNAVVFRIGYRCILVGGLLMIGCTSKKRNLKDIHAPVASIKAPLFNSDSAYFFIQQQVNFGPRIPNTEAHTKAGDYLATTCKNYGADVIIQKFEALTYAGQRLFLKNIIARYAPHKKKRILLAAHWDTRPFADKDVENSKALFDGANDGASGVGILLEIARLLGQGNPPEVGVDILFFDGEDFGEPMGQQVIRPPSEWDSWWCLGSQYWAKNKHIPNYSAYYGILLDMVGAKQSQFFREGVSREYASRIVGKIWNTAIRLGYSSYFVKQNAVAIIDDHVYVNKWAHIPMVNIVHYHSEEGYFGDYHHSQKDNMDIISKETLEAVGRTVTHVIYYEKK